MTNSFPILPAAKAVSDTAFSLAEETEIAQAAFIDACNHFKDVLLTFNFAQHPAPESTELALLDWQFQALTNLRNRFVQEPVLERMVPALNEVLDAMDHFLETAHLLADKEVNEAIHELQANDFSNYDDINDLDAL